MSIVDEFQHNPDKHVLIGNCKVIALGYSLDDQVGSAPRFLFYFPDFNIDDTHQVGGRIYRQGTKSNATIRMLYAKGDHMAIEF